jgi:hypothetical protein
MQRPVGQNLAAVPEVAMARIQFLDTAGNQDAIGGLGHPAPRRDENPTQPGRQNANPDRIGAILASESLDFHFRDNLEPP